MSFERTFDWVKWEPVSEEAVRTSLTGNYKDVDFAMDMLRDGQNLRTPFAEYRFVPDPAAPVEPHVTGLTLFVFGALLPDIDSPGIPIETAPVIDEGELVLDTDGEVILRSQVGMFNPESKERLQTFFGMISETNAWHQFQSEALKDQKPAFVLPKQLSFVEFSWQGVAETLDDLGREWTGVALPHSILPRTCDHCGKPFRTGWTAIFTSGDFPIYELSATCMTALTGTDFPTIGRREPNHSDIPGDGHIPGDFAE